MDKSTLTILTVPDVIHLPLAEKELSKEIQRSMLSLDDSAKQLTELVLSGIFCARLVGRPAILKIRD